MSARARRKNRNRGLKKGFRRENGLTPRHKIQPRRDAARLASDRDDPPAHRGDGARPPRDTDAWVGSLADASPADFPDLFAQAVTDDAGQSSRLATLLTAATHWCREHGAHRAALELHEINLRLAEIGDDLDTAWHSAQEEIAALARRADHAGCLSPAAGDRTAAAGGTPSHHAPSPSPAPPRTDRPRTR